MTPAEMEARARELVSEQREARGWEKGDTVMVEGNRVSTLKLGRYDWSDPENEGRAATILYLRRKAARLEHPIP